MMSSGAMANSDSCVSTQTLGGISCTWDARLETFTISDSTAWCVHLDVSAPDALARGPRALADIHNARLAAALHGIAEALRTVDEDSPDASLSQSLSSLSCHLLWLCEGRPNRSELAAACIDIADALPAQSPEQAWQIAFRSRTSIARRYKLLKGAVGVLASQKTSAVREIFWWTVVVWFRMAAEWHKAAPSAASTAAIKEAATAYRGVLMDAGSPQTLESFLALLKTSTEKELMMTVSVLEPLEPLSDTEARLIGAWYLRRYDLPRAAKISMMKRRPRETAAAAGALGAVIVAGVLFYLQRALWVQIIAQAFALGLVVVGAPRVFALLLPRALFGSLIAWLTVILAETASLLPISKDAAVNAARNASHEWLSMSTEWWPVIHTHDVVRACALVARDWRYVVVFLLCMLVAFSFLSIELSARLFVRGYGRSLLCFGIMFAGALYWGAMLAPAVHVILKSEAAPEGGCRCLLPALIYGSALAVDFGLLIQLIWDEKSVTDAFR
jgi:hypothetical protein